MFAASIVPAVMGPQVVPSAKEVDSKLSNFVRQISNVEWNHFRTTDLTRPPSETVHRPALSESTSCTVDSSNADCLQ